MTMECYDTTCPKHPRDEPYCGESVCVRFVKRLRVDARRSRVSLKGRHAQNFGLAFGYWPCVGGPYIRIQVSSFTLEVWYGIAGQRL